MLNRLYSEWKLVVYNFFYLFAPRIFITSFFWSKSKFSNDERASLSRAYFSEKMKVYLKEETYNVELIFRTILFPLQIHLNVITQKF